MKADILSAFASSGGGPDAWGARSASHTGTWQQQFQRAQAVGWFCRSEPLSSADKAEDSSSALRLLGRPPLGPSTHALMKAVASRGSPAVASANPARGYELSGTSAPDYRQTATDSASAVSATRCEGTTPRLALPSPTPALVEQSVPDLDSPESARTLQASAKQDGQSAPRIHIEEGPQGLHLWLGVDSTLAEVNARVSAVAAELRWHCDRAGLRLAAITCNGVSLPTGAKLVSQKEEP